MTMALTLSNFLIPLKDLKNDASCFIMHKDKCKAGKFAPARRVSTVVRPSIINELASASTSAVSADFNWETTVGALAGVTPFVIAGIEFTKRINAQKKCSVCKGSGLVQREIYYFRCYKCGGFLPWQSWKRFFSG